MKTKTLQKVCVHTDVVTQINNAIKIVDRVYLIQPSNKNPVKTYSKPMNFEGWTCVGVVKDKHNVANSKKTRLETEHEIWVNNKNLDTKSTIFKGLQQKSIEDNVIQDPDGRYQIVKNYSTVSDSWNFDQDDPKSAKSAFDFMCDTYLDLECGQEDCLINCEDFEEDIEYNKDGTLKHAYAKDHEGNIIFGIYDTKNN